MKSLIAVLATLVLAAGTAAAESVPDLKGIWTGPFRTLIYGHNDHHPGDQTADAPPRIRDIIFSVEVVGQDGRLLWGTSWSDPAKKEPFAGTLSMDGKTIIGADTDGSLVMNILGPDSVEVCYTQTAATPSQAIIASCGVTERQK
jgi:hypothetical protein